MTSFHELDNFAVITTRNGVWSCVSDVLQLANLASPLPVRKLPRGVSVHHALRVQSQLLVALF